MLREREGSVLGRTRLTHPMLPRQGALVGGLALTLLALPSCQASSLSRTARGGTVPAVSSASVSSSRNHVLPGMNPLFASITFTHATTYDDAVALLWQVGTTPYPWTCDDPRTPVPPPEDQLRAAFAASHQLLLSDPVDAQLNQLATSAQVLSVEAVALYMCP